MKQYHFYLISCPLALCLFFPFIVAIVVVSIPTFFSFLALWLFFGEGDEKEQRNQKQEVVENKNIVFIISAISVLVCDFNLCDYCHYHYQNCLVISFRLYSLGRMEWRLIVICDINEIKQLIVVLVKQ